MIPLFTTDYSIGKSILKFRPNNDHEDGPDSVLQIAKEHGLKHIFLVEDRMHGFLDYLRYSQSANFHFSFGLRCKIQENIEESNNHKIIIFAKDDEVRQIHFRTRPRTASTAPPTFRKSFPGK